MTLLLGSQRNKEEIEMASMAENAYDKNCSPGNLKSIIVVVKAERKSIKNRSQNCSLCKIVDWQL